MTKKKIAAIATVLVVGIIGTEYYKRKHLADEIVSAQVLKENEKQKIIVDTKKKTVTTVRRDNTKQVVKVREGARKVVVTETMDGALQVTAITKGFCLEPGLALYYSDQARLGLDVQVAYWKEWGVLLGGGINMGDEPRTVRLHIAVNRTIPLDFIDNTTAFIGVDHKKDVVAGLRIQF